jgi:uncharacterized protein
MAVKVAILFLSLCAAVLADLAAGQQAYHDGDYASALKEFLPLAKQGNAIAQVHLAFMYFQGYGVPQDYKEAMKWFRLAADQGYIQAQNELGVMYAKGEGVPQDSKEAMKWYRKAAGDCPERR